MVTRRNSVAKRCGGTEKSVMEKQFRISKLRPGSKLVGMALKGAARDCYDDAFARCGGGVVCSGVMARNPNGLM